jgi:alkylation response protein AidB-like acyl-CoA dehydrogenase
VGAQALGIARAAFEFALDYAKQRKQFGRALIDNEAIAFMLADMATEIEATRALIWRALWEGRHDGEFKHAEGSMPLKAGEVAVKVTEQAIQICGGYGYIGTSCREWHATPRSTRCSKAPARFSGWSREPCGRLTGRWLFIRAARRTRGSRSGAGDRRRGAQ